MLPVDFVLLFFKSVFFFFLSEDSESITFGTKKRQSNSSSISTTFADQIPNFDVAGNCFWFGNIVYDITAVVISTSDFITDALVVADFYEKDRMEYFWASIIVFSNDVFFLLSSVYFLKA